MSPNAADAIRLGTNPSYLTRMDAALALGVSVKTLAKWAVERKGPPFIRNAHGSAYYDRATLLDWRSRQSVTLRYAFAGAGADA